MKYEKAKLFWKEKEGKKKIFVSKWDETVEEYYSFVKRMLNDDFHQITITSEMMLEFMKIIATSLNSHVEKIEMMEEDFEQSEMLNNIVGKCKANRGYYTEMIDCLKRLAEESSIEIMRVYFSKQDNLSNLLMYMQVNGVVGFSGYGSELENVLVDLVEEHINE